MHQGRRLWLLAGTGEGPDLAHALLQRGWRLRVSVLTAAATRPYRALFGAAAAEALELTTGAFGGAQGLAAALRQAIAAADPFMAAVDATHPFAQRISADLLDACAAERVPLLRLSRQPLPLGDAELLPNLQALSGLELGDQRVLLALGARQLDAAVQCSPRALHHARLLPQPGALQLALAAGLLPERLACLRPTAGGQIEAALVRRWRIGTIVCRQSGGRSEALWHRVSQACGARLLLLARPLEPAEACCSAATLLAKLESLSRSHSRG
jgi:precorrin-6A/cobalt-precorrin-6A reductase